MNDPLISITLKLSEWSAIQTAMSISGDSPRVTSLNNEFYKAFFDAQEKIQEVLTPIQLEKYRKGINNET